MTKRSYRKEETARLQVERAEAQVPSEDSPNPSQPYCDSPTSSPKGQVASDTWRMRVEPTAVPVPESESPISSQPYCDKPTASPDGHALSATWRMRVEPAHAVADASDDDAGLLAIDVGVKCGFARFSAAGRLEWFQARDFGSRSRLKRAAEKILDEQMPLAAIVIEGGGELAQIWRRAAARRDIALEQVSAETWRPDLLLPREQRGTAVAKQAALELAKTVIADHGKKSPNKLRADAAEAILVGFWAARKRGWLPED